jgi:hypothetical protein
MIQLIGVKMVNQINLASIFDKWKPISFNGSVYPPLVSLPASGLKSDRP